jgi:hypothetical protein
LQRINEEQAEIMRRVYKRRSSKSRSRKVAKLINNSNINRNSINNNISNNKSLLQKLKEKKLKIKKNVHDKKENENYNAQNINQNFGLFIKLEGFCFPDKVHNLNYDNLKYYFNLLFKEYITENGINSDNTIDTRKFLEKKIDYNTKFFDNPMSAMKEDFVNSLNNSSFNYEEQFFINRIAFMKFKEYGASLSVIKVFEILKSLQTSNYEEKLRIVLNILDIHDNKLISRTEFEKLLVFLTIQNHNNNHRIYSILDEIFGKSLVLPYEKLFFSCLEKPLHQELFFEILQISSERDLNIEEK